MKTKLLLSILLSFAFYLLSSQVPQGFNYQAIARNSSGDVIASYTFPLVTFDIQTSTGTVVYEESFTSVTSNASGLITLAVGTGTYNPTYGQFSSINWKQPLYLKTIIEYPGSTMTTMGTSQIWAVPYSLVAKDVTGPLTNLGISATATAMNSDSSLFEVKNQSGQTVFAIYDHGVRAYVGQNTKSKKGGFAVGGFGTDKAGESTKYMYIDKDSARIYLDTDPLTKTQKGGFAIGGYDLTKGVVQNYLHVSSDSVRIYIDSNPATKKVKGGFAVGGYDMTKGTNDNYMNVNTDASGTIQSQNRILWYPLKNAFLAGRVRIGTPDSVGVNSFATGYESKSRGIYSQALGFKAIANGDYSTAIGKNAVANNINSFAFGDSARAINAEGYAIGRGAVASGYRSFAFGSAGIDSVGQATGVAYAKGAYSFAIGQGSQTLGTGSFAFGLADTAKGDYSVALGYETTSPGYGATSMGMKTKANGWYSIAAGYGTTSTGNGSNAFGIGSAAYAGSTAFGSHASAIGSDSFAEGYYSSAIGAMSIAMGSQAGANIDYAISLGCSTTSNGLGSISMGYFSAAKKNYSIAIGQNSTADGISALAIGCNNLASGDYSVALGYFTVASGYKSTTMGSKSKASGVCAVAMGDQTTASGWQSVALGTSTTAGGNNSLAAGELSNGSGQNSIAFGYSSVAGGASSLAGGGFAYTVSDYSFSFGVATMATGYNSVALGENTKACSGYEMAIGRYNTIYTPVSVSGWDASDRLFVIGNGTGSSIRADAMTVLKNGNIGIGTDSPSQILDVNGNARFRSVGSGTFAYNLNLTSDGTLTTATSDISMKENINQITDALKQVNRLRGVTFTWKNDSTMTRQIGMIAQEVEPVVPEIVFTNPVDGLKGINYSQATALLVEAIKEQQKEIDELKALVNSFIANQTAQVNK